MCLDVINQTWSPMFGMSLSKIISSLPTQQQQRAALEGIQEGLYAFGIMTQQSIY